MIRNENLQLHLGLGLNFTKKKMNQVLEFNQSQWLKLYIKLKTQKRTEAEKSNVDDEKRYTN